MKRRTFLAFATSAMLLVACGQSTTDDADPDLLQRINDGGTINVGTEGTYPPFTYHDQSGQLTGYDVEVTRAIADKLGVDVNFNETQWDAMLAGLDSGRFDMVANQVSLTTPEREAKYDKVTPYNWSGAAVLAPDYDERFKSWEDLKGMRSAQSLTSNYGELAERYEAEIVPVDGMAQAVQLVKQGRADLTMNDHLAILDYLQNFPDSGLEVKLVAPESEQRGSGLVLLKGNDEAVAKLDEAMAELQADGTLTQISQEFFGADISQKQ